MHAPVILIASLLAPSPASQPAGNDPVVLVLNEIRIDQPGAATDEYAELLGGPPGASLDRITYLVIGDDASGALGSGVIEEVVSLSGNVIGPEGLVLIAESTLTIGAGDIVTDLNFEDEDNVTHLIVRDFTGALGDDLDTNDDGQLDVTPWSSVDDALSVLATDGSVGPGQEYGYGPSLGFAAVGPDGPIAPGHVFRCVEGNFDWRIGGFAVSSIDSPGSLNSQCNPRTTVFCDPPAPNSFSPSGGLIGLDGSGSIQRNDNALVAIAIPSAFGIFVQADAIGPAVTSVFGGELCLSSNVRRLTTILFPIGNVSRLELDFTDGTAVESSTMAGSTVYYQYAHRDTQFPGGGNWTSGIAITWVP
ncbi:MAG: hypothetical protein AAF726_18040 [Planctomycetota bacterium]